MKLILILLPFLLASCSEKLRRVKLLDRDIHGKPVMADTTDPLHRAMTEHAYFSREGSFGGGGIGGGGCGCN